MKLKHFISIYYILMALLLSSCFNIFSLLPPGDPDTITSVDVLMANGQKLLDNLEYEEAYDTYMRVIELQPSNSAAREGAATAYIFWKMPLTNVIKSVINSAYSNMDFNTLYGVGKVVSEILYPILDQQCDGNIPYDDVNVNLNFFLFNTLYGAFYVADTDNDTNVYMDTNDYFIIYPDFSFSNNLQNTTNTFMGTLLMINRLQEKIAGFDSILTKSQESIAIVSNAIYSDEARALINDVTSQLLSVRDTLTSNVGDSSNLTVFSQFGFTDNYDITNLLNGSQYTNFDTFNSELLEYGITNYSDMTNYYEDLTNFGEIVSNFYGL